MKKRGDSVLTKIKILGFPLEIPVEKGKTIRNWPVIRKLLDMKANDLMQLARMRQAEAMKAKQGVTGGDAEKDEGSVGDAANKAEIADSAAPAEPITLDNLFDFKPDDMSDGPWMGIWNGA
jgi:hypothetical protein